MLTSELYLHMESTFKSLDSLPRTVFVFVFVYVFVYIYVLYLSVLVLHVIHWCNVKFSSYIQYSIYFYPFSLNGICSNKKQINSNSFWKF